MQIKMLMSKSRIMPVVVAAIAVSPASGRVTPEKPQAARGAGDKAVLAVPHGRALRISFLRVRPMPFIKTFLAIVLVLLFDGACWAREFRVGDIVVSSLWSRATPNGAKVGAGYMVIENRGNVADRLVGGSVEAAARFEIHDTVVEQGVMRMRQLPGLELPPGEAVEVKPGGRHIMFVDLEYPLSAEQNAKGRLQFERAGTIEVEYEVIRMGARPPGGRKE
jgi:periplasmic copper chaperone A